MHPVEQYLKEREDLLRRQQESYEPIRVNGAEFDSPIPTQRTYILAPKNQMSLVEFTRFTDELLAQCKDPMYNGHSRRNTVWRDKIYFPLLSFLHTEATVKVTAPEASVTISQDDKELASYTHKYTQELPVPRKVHIGCFPYELFDHVQDVEEGVSREVLGNLNESFATPNWLERQVEKLRLRPSKFL